MSSTAAGSSPIRVKTDSRPARPGAAAVMATEDNRKGTTSVALGDENVLLRESLASLLARSAFTVIGQSGDVPGLLAIVRDHRPDLAIVDIRMPPGHSTEGLE